MKNTCSICGYQSIYDGDFYTSITGSINCIRCYCSWSPNYIEPPEFTERYNQWERVIKVIK